jgi:hypothetical protein
LKAAGSKARLQAVEQGPGTHLGPKQDTESCKQHGEDEWVGDGAIGCFGKDVQAQTLPLPDRLAARCVDLARRIVAVGSRPATLHRGAALGP